MDPWVYWVIAAVILAVGEIMTLSFFLGPFAIGALAAAVADVAGLPLAVGLAAFIVISILALWIVRPIARAHRRMPAQLRTGTAALIGRSAVVTERIANREDVGAIKLEGETWTARAYDEDDVIPAGRKVQVVDIRGATALVTDGEDAP